MHKSNYFIELRILCRTTQLKSHAISSIDYPVLDNSFSSKLDAIR